MQIVITDVTEMHQGNYCVAGWCPKSEKMVRPLPKWHELDSGPARQIWHPARSDNPSHLE
jgi:hypothetical protein